MNNNTIQTVINTINKYTHKLIHASQNIIPGDMQKVATLALGVMIMFLGAAYLHVSNQAATMGFALQGLKQENTMLSEELGALNIAAAQEQTMFAMKSNPKIQGMDVVNKKQYVVMKNGQVEMVTMRLPDEYVSQMGAY